MLIREDYTILSNYMYQSITNIYVVLYTTTDLTICIWLCDCLLAKLQSKTVLDCSRQSPFYTHKWRALIGWKWRILYCVWLVGFGTHVLLLVTSEWYSKTYHHQDREFSFSKDLQFAFHIKIIKVIILA